MGSLSGPLRLLDVGGTAEFWLRTSILEDFPQLEITVANLSFEPGSTRSERLRLVEGDARDLRDVADGAFDVVFSNSVIEHVGGRIDQQRMANEIRRVGRRYFVQTPSFWFPIEPHFLFPLFQFFPIGMRTWLHTRFDLGWMKSQPDRTAARADVEAIQLLTARQLAALFPEARIHRERFLGLTKSLMAAGWCSPARVDAWVARGL